jgi:hypothetical protein
LNEQRQEVRAPYSPTRVLRIIQFSHHNSLPTQFNYWWGQIKQIRSTMLPLNKQIKCRKGGPKFLDIILNGSELLTERARSHANKQIADDNRILDVE